MSADAARIAALQQVALARSLALEADRSAAVSAAGVYELLGEAIYEMDPAAAGAQGPATESAGALTPGVLPRLAALRSSLLGEGGILDTLAAQADR